MARVLITGASGFIGGHLVAQAIERGDEVTAAIRKGSNTSRLTNTRVSILELPMHDQGVMSQILEKAGHFNMIIHNAGVTKAVKKTEYYEVNEGNTRRLIAALQVSNRVPDRFLFVSSLAALGAAEPDLERIFSGQSPKPLTTYGDSKLHAEKYIEGLGKSFPWIIVRPTAVYGPWEQDILIFIRMIRRGLEITIGTSGQRLSFIHAHDVARAIFHLLDHPDTLHHKFILSDGCDYYAADLGKAVRAAIGRKNVLKIRLSAALLQPVAVMSEMMGKWQKKAVPLNREKLAELSAENWHCDAGLLLNEAGFKPVFNLYNGMKNSVDWYVQEKWL